MNAIDAAWAALDAKHAAEERGRKPWDVPASQPVHFPEGSRWWHRMQGHHTRSRYDLIAAPYAWQCLECDLTIGRH